MSQQTIETIGAQPTTYLTAEDLRWAVKVAEQLQHRGVGIFNAYHNGRRVVLQVERNPDFAATHVAMTKREPTAEGVKRTYVANHLGVQIQWSELELTLQAVANG